MSFFIFCALLHPLTPIPGRNTNRVGPVLLLPLLVTFHNFVISFFSKACWSPHCALFAVLQATGEPPCSPGQGVHEKKHTRRKNGACAEGQGFQQRVDPEEQDLELRAALSAPA